MEQSFTIEWICKLGEQIGCAMLWKIPFHNQTIRKKKNLCSIYAKCIIFLLKIKSFRSIRQLQFMVSKNFQTKALFESNALLTVWTDHCWHRKFPIAINLHEHYTFISEWNIKSNSPKFLRISYIYTFISLGSVIRF